MRLIDADALMVKNHENVAVAHNERAAQLLENIMNAPTIEARPVVRGEWIPMIDEPTPLRNYAMLTGYRCSICGRCEDKEDPFCHCGADMRGAKDG